MSIAIGMMNTKTDLQPVVGGVHVDFSSLRWAQDELCLQLDKIVRTQALNFLVSKGLDRPPYSGRFIKLIDYDQLEEPLVLCTTERFAEFNDAAFCHTVLVKTALLRHISVFLPLAEKVLRMPYLPRPDALYAQAMMRSIPVSDSDPLYAHDFVRALDEGSLMMLAQAVGGVEPSVQELLRSDHTSETQLVGFLRNWLQTGQFHFV